MAHPTYEFDDQTDLYKSPQDAVVDSLTLTHQDLLDAVETFGQAYVQSIGRAHAEIQELIANRLRADAETQAAFLQCRTLADLQAIQVRFFETAFRQYVDGVTSLMGLGAGVMTQGIPSTIRPG